MSLLPPEVRFLQRGWLNANQILITGGDGPVLLDTGHVIAEQETLDLLHAQNVHPQELRLLINTHGHIDHFGGNWLLRSLTDTPLACGPMTATFFAEDDRHAMWLDDTIVEICPQSVRPFVQADITLQPGETIQLGGLSFQVLSLPGHAPDTIGFFQPDSRLLLCADAMLPGESSVIHHLVWRDGLTLALDTIAQMRALDAKVALSGHGPPITDVPANLDAVERILREFQARPDKLIRHTHARVMLFALLSLQPVDRDAFCDIIQRGQNIQQYAAFFNMTPQTFVSKSLENFLQRGLIQEHNQTLSTQVPA